MSEFDFRPKAKPQELKIPSEPLVEDIVLEGQPASKNQEVWIPDVPVAKPFVPEDVMRKELETTAEAFGRGGLQGATMGFSDEIAAAASTGSLSNEEYAKYRDEVRAANAEAARKSPIAYGSGTVAGTVATAALPTKLPLLGRLLAPVKVGKDAGVLAGVAGDVTNAAIQSGVAGAGFSEKEGFDAVTQDALDAAKFGAGVAAPVGLLARGMPAIAQLAGETAAGQRLVKSFKQTQKTGEIPGSAKDLARLQKEGPQLQGEVATALKGGLTKQEEALRSNLLKLRDEARNVVDRTKTAYGEQLGMFVDDILENNPTGNYADSANEIIKRLDDAVEAGLVKEESIRGLRNQALKVSGVKAPAAPVKVTKADIEKLVQSVDEEGELLGTPKMSTTEKYKIGGKDATLEEVLAAKAAADEVKPAGASQEIIKQSTPKADIKTTKAITEEILMQTPEQLDNVSTQELTKLREIIKKGLNNKGDPNLQAQFKQAYGIVTEKLASKLPDAEAQKIYKDLRNLYATGLDLEDQVAKTSFGNLLEGTSGVPSLEQADELAGIYKGLEKLEPTESVKAMPGQVKQSAQELAEVQRLQSKYLPSEPTAGGGQIYPEIQKGMVATEIPVTKPTSQEGAALLGALEKADPAAKSRLEPLIRNYAEQMDLAGVTQEGATLVEGSPLTSPFRAILGSARQLPVKVGGIAAKTVDSVKQPWTQGVNKAIGGVSALQKMDEAGLQATYQKAVDSGKKALGAVLKTAIGKDNVARNAALFMISQDANMKRDLEDLTKEDASNLDFKPKGK